MDFVVCLPSTTKLHGSICVIVDKMTKSSHFILLKSTSRVEDYAKLYIDEIVRWNRIALSIISDRGSQFTPTFWKSFQKSMCTQV